MEPINRRRFVQTCALGAFGALLPAGFLKWRDLALAAEQRPLMDGAGVLVLITLNGGNDGLNTLVPYRDAAYYDGRPELAIPPEDVLILDDSFGLNPSLSGFSNLFSNNSLAVVHGVGYPEQDRSHFRSMDIWQTASLDNSVETGWIGRWLDTNDLDPLSVLVVGNTLPTLAIGQNHSAATISGNIIPTGDLHDLLAGLALPDRGDSAAMALVRDSYRTATGLADHFETTLQDNEPTKLDIGDGGLTGKLKAVANCINAGVPTRVYSVTLSGFDTHASELGTHQRLLKSLDQAVTDLLTDVSATKHGKDVVVMIYSEFGRRVHANASDGTDHGTSGPVFIAGPRVRGGFYGDAPNLRDLDDGDLKTTTDFRDIYFEILAHTLAADPESVLGRGRKALGYL